MNKMYLFGGFNGQSEAAMFRLTLPEDLCRAITFKNDCTALTGCSWCEVHSITQEGNATITTNQSSCYSVTSQVPMLCRSGPNVTKVTLLPTDVTVFVNVALLGFYCCKNIPQFLFSMPGKHYTHLGSPADE